MCSDPTTNRDSLEAGACGAPRPCRVVDGAGACWRPLRGLGAPSGALGHMVLLDPTKGKEPPRTHGAIGGLSAGWRHEDSCRMGA